VLDVAGVPAGAAGDAALASLSEPLDDITLRTCRSASSFGGTA